LKEGGHSLAAINRWLHLVVAVVSIDAFSEFGLIFLSQLKSICRIDLRGKMRGNGKNTPKLSKPEAESNNNAPKPRWRHYYCSVEYYEN
jgi:hypothetical protein